MSDLKEQLIRLGSTHPELRKHIRQILAIQMRGNLFPDLVKATQDMMDRYGYHAVRGYKGSQDAVEVFTDSGYGPESLIVGFLPAGEDWIRVTISDGRNTLKKWTVESDTRPSDVASDVIKQVHKEMKR